MSGYDDRALLHGRYRLEVAIGQGGFGTTWRAHDTTLDMPVCIKEYFDNNSGIIQSVYGEARSLADFRDEPGIVQVLDAFMEDGRAYLVMELLEGEDLSAFVAERGALSLDDTLTLLKPVFQALERVHEAGVVHRDVSPDNIRVVKDKGSSAGFSTKLMDFGAVVLQVEDGRDPQTMSSHTTVLIRPGQAASPRDGSTARMPHVHAAADDVVIIRPGYSSPEQYRTSHGLTPAADVYSLAVTIWFCLTGANPRTEMYVEGETFRVVPPSQARRGCIDTKREKVLMQALSYGATDRPQTVRELWEELQPPKPKPWKLTAVTAVAVAAVVEGLFALSQATPLQLPALVSCSRTDLVPVRDGLADYSWAELGEIGSSISEAGSRSEALRIAASYHLVSDDGQMLPAEKSLDFGRSTIGLRVVDVYHDDLAGGGKAGLTLMDVNAGLHGPVNVASSDESNVDDQDWVINVGGWRDSNIRKRLQDLEPTLPQDLLAAIKPVLKSTNNEGLCTDEDTEAVSTTSDTLWVPSLVEVGGEVDWLKKDGEISDFYNTMANNEGAQYAAFEQAGVTSAYNTASLGAIAKGNGKCWLRSTSMETGRARCIQGLDPSYTASADEYNAYMLGFCL